jgi:hypothetical protein
MDHRRDKRHEINVTAEVFLPDRVLEATTRNLSRSGVCFECEPALHEGDTVAATLYLTVDGIEDAATEPIKLTTRIQWTSDPEDEETRSMFGASFLELDEGTQSRLDRFLKALGD